MGMKSERAPNFTISDPPSILLWLLLQPFFYFYDKIKWYFFRPEPMALFAIMLDTIDRRNEYVELMKRKGFVFKKCEA